MTDFATLFIAADTRQMKQAEKAIDGVTRAGGEAERATDALGMGFDVSGKNAETARGKFDTLGGDAGHWLRRWAAFWRLIGWILPLTHR